MDKKIIYVLHEYGANSHYNALVALAKKNGYKVAFRRFTLVRQFKNSIKKQYSWKDFFLDIYFFLCLPFMKGCKIVLGIAPFNSQLVWLIKILRKQEVYYHTSYTHWDGTIMAHPTKSKAVLSTWRFFTSKFVKHIFVVSEKTKDELVLNKFAHSIDISVVKHSFNVPIEPNVSRRKTNTFIFVGRIVKEKGIEELLDYFSQNKNASLIIVGDGKLVNKVVEYARKYNNIKYLGYCNTLNKLIPLYHSASFVLMNSHRTKVWEELFGIALIEGMACGCIPIATDHPGPLEIITNGVNGFICKEGDIKSAIKKAIDMSDEQYKLMSESAFCVGQSYYCYNMASKWSAILN